MKERIKSWMLVLLIFGSLVESYYLIYRLPGSDSAVLSKTLYVKTDNMGPEEKVENLLYPDKMIIHMGGDKHTLFYPSSTFYNLIMNRLKGRSFESFQRRSVQDFDWDKIRSENPGIELSFGAGIPVTLLQRVMQISPDSLFEGRALTGSGSIISKMTPKPMPSSSAHAGILCTRRLRPILRFRMCSSMWTSARI